MDARGTLSVPAQASLLSLLMLWTAPPPGT